MAREKYQNLPEEEKNKNRQCSCELYKSLSEEEKTKNVSMAVNDIKIIQIMKNKG